MIRSLFVSLFGSFVFLAIAIYCYLEQQHHYKCAKLLLPKYSREIAFLREEVASYRYQINSFKNPEKLLKMVARPEYAHLSFPLVRDIITLEKEGESSSDLSRKES